jgi:hypothetical protein
MENLYGSQQEKLYCVEAENIRFEGRAKSA